MTEVNIIFQNKNYVAVNKPEGLSVHNNEDPINLLKVLSDQLKTDKLFPVHRLDKETSGVQVIALNPATANLLAQEFQSRAVVKTYVGLLRGVLKTNFGSWNKPLTDKSEGRKKPQGVSKDRVPCQTQFKVIKANKYFTLCEFDLITGRQHQIRKHSALDNHALVGDSRYGDPKYNQMIFKKYNIERMFLHCQSLVIDGNNLRVPAPDVFFSVF